MPAEKLSFENSQGEKLAARLDTPEGRAPLAYALFAHCFTCSKNLSAAGHISRALNAEGIAVLRFDFTGLGESEGDFSDTNFSSNVEDLVEAAEFLETNYRAPEILVGHSLGGAAVLQAAGRIPSAKAVATIGAPFDPAHARRLFPHKAAEIEAEGLAEVDLAGRRFTIKRQFLQDLEAHALEDEIAGLDRALLVFHGPLDNIVGIEQAAHIFTAARHPKSFVTLDQADHLLSDPADSRYVGHVLSAWAGRYVGIDPAKVQSEDGPSSDQTSESLSASAAEPLPHGLVTARLEGEGFKTVIRAGRHTILADEPKSVGGSDLGLNPYDHLLAALGACTVMTLRMYANLKKIPLEAVDVSLKHSKVHARDCEDCETEKGKVDLIERGLRLEGEITEAQRQRMLEIADRCPVHRTLGSETKIRSVLR